MRQRMLSALLAASMVLTMAPVAFAADANSDVTENIEWTRNTYTLGSDTTLKNVYEINADTNTVYTIDVDTHTLTVGTINVGKDSGLTLQGKEGGSVEASADAEAITFKVDGQLTLGSDVAYNSPVQIYKLTPDTAATQKALISRATATPINNGTVTINGGTYTKPVTVNNGVKATVPAEATVDGTVVAKSGATLTVEGTVETVTVEAGADVEINGTVETVTVEANATVVINGKVDTLKLPAGATTDTITIGDKATITDTQIGATTYRLIAVYPNGESHGTVEIYSLTADSRVIPANNMGAYGTDPVGNLYSVRANTGAKLVANVTPDPDYYVESIWYINGLDGLGELNGMQLVENNTFTCDMPAEATSLVVNYAEESHSTSGGGGGGGGAAGSYSVSVATAENGTVSVSPKNAVPGTTVTVTVTPDEGYELDELIVTDEDGNTIAVKDEGDGKYTFTMPESRVTIKATFVEFGTNLPFTDVSSSAWYADAVRYVYKNGMMNGTSDTEFSPNATTNRAMLVTILHRLENTPSAAASSFTDVVSGSYYADAVNWAAANGIVNGITATNFAPNTAITREQMATILYRYAQYKGYDVSASNNLSAYTDAANISSYATTAMQWVNAEGLITGNTTTTLNPTGNATRAEVATILMRFCENVAK